MKRGKSRSGKHDCHSRRPPPKGVPACPFSDVIFDDRVAGQQACFCDNPARHKRKIYRPPLDGGVVNSGDWLWGLYHREKVIVSLFLSVAGNMENAGKQEKSYQQ